MRIVRSGTSEFNEALKQLCERGYERDEEVEAAVQRILTDVKHKGDAAVLEYTERFDGMRLPPSEMEIPQTSLSAALRGLSAEILRSLRMAAERIHRFHTHQQFDSWSFIDSEGVLLGQRITPLDRVGIYVPGGKAAYPSSVLMNGIPAKIAGVKEIIMVTPPACSVQNPVVLAAASLCGIDRVFRIGGAQAIAALAYGTECIPKVDKIVGPGSVYIETAKRMVFGQVDVDMIAGPSEILIISDGTTDPSFLAADLLAQAEHDEKARPILVSMSMLCIEKVVEELRRQMPLLKTQKTASQAIAQNGVAFLVDTLEEAAALSNTIAPEHLELAVKDTEPLLAQIRHAGAIFIGAGTPETIGDYLAGPNHVLPTGGTARFFSPLGVYDFVKRSSIIRMDQGSLERLGPVAARIARVEGLEAHARSIDIRLQHPSKVPTR